ncbi:MAG TPA: outer membrane protein assembly factor BamE [Blastocatellia bacterium]|jgi:outer membrane protein assembly factor BamE (lipoprotein component of BamABCDE complex)
MKKVLIVSLVTVLGLPIAELAREEISYLMVSRAMKNAAAHIKPDMTKDEVRDLVGQPHSTKYADEAEFWYWSSEPHQGKLWSLLGLAWVKGHQSLSVEFDSRDRVVQTWRGVN